MNHDRKYADCVRFRLLEMGRTFIVLPGGQQTQIPSQYIAVFRMSTLLRNSAYPLRDIPKEGMNLADLRFSEGSLRLSRAVHSREEPMPQPPVA